MKKITYLDAKVDIKNSNHFIESIKDLVKNTAIPGTNANIGGFSGYFDPKAAGCKDPIFLSTTDGVGTKIKIALEMNIYNTIGHDLVAMCVNDLVVSNARPLFFLDYLAVAKLDVQKGHDIIYGITEACKEAGCALVGGETAEMPGMYQNQDYDLAGFAVGYVERDEIVDPHSCSVGDIILGLESSGVHSNGFSLIRHIIEQNNLKYKDVAPFNKNQLLGEALLIPTKIYVASCLQAYKTKAIKAMAHITGGGYKDNIARILPDHLTACININKLPKLPIFSWLEQYVDKLEMLQTFNCGVGMIMIVKKEQVEHVSKVLTNQNETVHILGHIEQNNRNQKVELHDK